MHNLDLVNDNIKKLFFKYLLPSISATLVTSIYVLADTIMIGNGVGAEGIAALNLVLPLFSLFFGTGYLLGVGGGVLMSFYNGKGDTKLANTYFTVSILCSILFMIFYLIVGIVFFYPIAYFLGSDENSISLVSEYGKYIVAGSPILLMSSMFQAFVRNDKAPKLAMIAVITGGILNVLLDYIFIFEFNMGIAGAAIATLIGTTISVIILLSHFLSKHNSMKLVKQSFKFKIVIKIFQSGISNFVIEAAIGLVTLIFNIQLLKYIGNVGVIVYGIIANSAIVAMSLFNGVAQASQPIMAVNFGAGKSKRVIEVRHLGIIVSSFIGLILFLLGFLFPKYMISIFVIPTDEILELGITAIRIYFISFMIMNINILYSTYFQSILKPNFSLVICLLRGFILSTILVSILPNFLGIIGIWIVIPLSEFITLLFSIYIIKKNK